MKHTKGPWTYRKTISTFTVETVDKIQVGTIKPMQRNVAQINQGTLNAEANAQLIAAAPDLLEALEDVLDDIERGETQWEAIGTIDSIKQAIAKAKRHRR